MDTPSANASLAPLESTRQRWPRISDYAIIGDSRSSALVSRAGSIDWLCWPRFDSGSVFASILDPDRGGCWVIRPTADFQCSRSYVYATNILRSTFRTSTGTAVLTDFMPVASEPAKLSRLTPDRELIRIVDCTDGEIELLFDFHPRPRYGRDAAKLKQVGALGIRFDSGRGAYWLLSSAPVRIADGHVTATLKLKKGDQAQFSFTYGAESPVVLPPLGELPRHKLEESIVWWRCWSQHLRYDGPNRDSVLRSALTLKLLTYAPSGAIVAAPTTSLPEQLGGALNWDYRYCWLRDASLTIRVLIGLGFYDEADAFFGWMLNATHRTQPQLRVLYDLFGSDSTREREFEHLSGYRNSRPVRIGNAAHKQLQLDVYGEVLDAAAQYAFNHGTFDRAARNALVDIGKYVAQNWNQPDQGIWEPRSAPQNHTHSRVLCWTALDRLITLCKKGHLDSVPTEDFCRERDRIAAQIHSRAWNPELQSYVSVLGGEHLDASLLLIPYYGFERADSSRMSSTYNCIRQRLRAGNHLLYRYKGAPEGAFGICSFWEVEYLALGGSSLAHAQNLFDELLKYQNDVGLLAEEIDPATGDALGNFPQAFTHIGLISAALSISERIQGEKQLAHREPSAEENKAA